MADGWLSLDGSWNCWLASRPFLRALARWTGVMTEHHQHVPWPASGILHHDVRRGLPFSDASVSAIFAAHFLEHLDEPASGALLRECHRVLQPGGVLRIIVPDLRQLASQYLAWTQEEDSARAGAAKRFVDSLNLAAFRTWPSGWPWRLIRHLSHAGHRSVHDEASLRELMKEGGFVDIRRCRHLQSRLPEFAAVETEDRHEASVCLEGIRPAGEPFGQAD